MKFLNILTENYMKNSSFFEQFVKVCVLVDLSVISHNDTFHRSSKSLRDYKDTRKPLL